MPYQRPVFPRQGHAIGQDTQSNQVQMIKKKIVQALCVGRIHEGTPKSLRQLKSHHGAAGMRIVIPGGRWPGIHGFPANDRGE